MDNSNNNQPYSGSTPRLIGLIVAVLAVAFGAVAYQNGWFGGDNSQAPQADTATTQTILPVNTQRMRYVDSIEQTRTYTGTIRAHRTSDLAFEMSGKIIEVLVNDGDQVEAGQVIARLDTDTLQAQQVATLAKLDQSKFLMSELDAGPRKQQIAAAVADTAAAKSEYDNAKVRADRRKGLYKSNAIPVEEYEQSKFDVQTAKALWQAAFERLSELKAGTRQEQLSAQLATVAQLQASAKEMKVSIDKGVLLAPYAGTITKHYLDPGSIAQPSSPVCTLIEQSKLEAWIGLPVNVAAKTKIGQQYTVLIDDSSYEVTASVKINELDMNTRTQAVLFKFSPEDAKTIVSGQLCQVQLTTKVATAGYWVPNSAISRGVRGLSSVMKLTPDADQPDLFRVHRCDVEIIKTDSQRVLVKGTISDGDRVVADGLHRLAIGQLVSLAEKTDEAADLGSKPRNEF